MHSHIYDEIVYIIDGEGILHLGEQEKVIGPGSTMHLPPLVEHCLENTGKGSMRSAHAYNTEEDIDAVLGALRENRPLLA
jgi:mannose-6-phosphate isomerase-like protein (cupin superfamily)